MRVQDENIEDTFSDTISLHAFTVTASVKTTIKCESGSFISNTEED
jgi:hypothetical protein